jgi:hypothetical protein
MPLYLLLANKERDYANIIAFIDAGKNRCGIKPAKTSSILFIKNLAVLGSINTTASRLSPEASEMKVLLE